MPRERENIHKKIKMVDYDIDGNLIRAYYNSAHELIFVLDETINADKPNVLLVIDSFDERKWDDVLANDYGMDLETIRPKKDNKYQKLDIEYGGLDVYSELIDAYESDDDVSGALENLKRFQIMAVRRSATERLSAAEETIDKSHETIERTNDVISELRARIKELRAKLSEQKRNIGREPTKASAAKILKTEAQIDAINDKLERAKKRLVNAQRRLTTAEDDAEIARAILARRSDVKPVRHTKAAATPKRTPVVTREIPDDDVDEDVDDDKYTEEYSETEPYETKAEEVADNEVKPLFDSDPNVLDDNIAFKPIDFNAAGDTHVAPMVTPEPLSFTPPSGTDTTPNNLESENAAPMLDSLTSVSQPTTEERIDVTATVEPASPDASVVTDSPEQTIDVVVETQPAPEPIHVEPITPVRPVSPITGSDVSSTDVRYTKRPTLIYYVMLILLIGLSIFTLWLYQQKNGAVVPDLAATTVASDITTKSTTGEIQETNIPSPFVNVDADQKEPEPVVEPASVETVVPDAVAEVVDDTPIQDVPAVVESEPVAVAVEPEPEPVAQESESVNVSVDSPFVDIRTVATYEPEKKPIPTEEEILARKPGYSVSQQDKMFVAAPEYDTETNVSSYNDYSLDTDVQPINVPEIVTSEVGAVVTDTGCANGASADEYGCCPGEIYLYTQDGYMCCSDDDCFPPLQ